MTLPRRIQLVKLLRQNGLRDVERMREDELKEALKKLRIVLPEPPVAAAPSSAALLTRAADPAPAFDEEDDIYALPRFREPRVLLPDGDRTFLRAIAVKPRVVFVTWDVSKATLDGARGPFEIWLFWRDFLGDAPPTADVLGQHPARRAAVELSAGGWYINVPGERLAVTAALVDADGRRLAESNTTLTPPARPAPPGPWWVATLPPSLDRRRLRERKLLTGEVKEASLMRLGESDSRGLDVEEEADVPSSASAVRLAWLQAPSSSSLAGGPSSGLPDDDDRGDA